MTEENHSPQLKKKGKALSAGCFGLKDNYRERL
jgi:hypothetical protein